LEHRWDDIKKEHEEWRKELDARAQELERLAECVLGSE
jgi:hypothetical protein